MTFLKAATPDDKIWEEHNEDYIAATPIGQTKEVKCSMFAE